jgi:hypothetical protein
MEQARTLLENVLGDMEIPYKDFELEIKMS